MYRYIRFLKIHLSIEWHLSCFQFSYPLTLWHGLDGKINWWVTWQGYKGHEVKQVFPRGDWWFVGKRSASRKCRKDRNGKEDPEFCHYNKDHVYPESVRNALTIYKISIFLLFIIVYIFLLYSLPEFQNNWMKQKV